MDRIYRALLGGAVLAGCILVLAGQSRAQATAAAVAAPTRVKAQQPPVAPSLFGTVAVKISAQRFHEEWERARRDATALPQLRRLVAPAAGLSRRRQIAYVQAAVHRAIKWRSDATQWGRHDYWASAEQTLRLGLGDMEDRAIVKMQALRALGVPTSDLYLTLGRDTVGGAQAVLIVRNGRGYYVLDDTGGAPFTTDQRPEFRPVLTFGYGASWVHSVPGARAVAAGGGTSRAGALTGGN